MEIPNYDSTDDLDKKYKQLFPFMLSDTFRMLICGNSGSGKTNLLYHMLIKPLLYFDEIYLYARNLEQDKYKKLMQKMRELSSKVGYEILHVSNDEISPVSEMDYMINIIKWKYQTTIPMTTQIKNINSYILTCHQKHFGC